MTNPIKTPVEIQQAREAAEQTVHQWDNHDKYRMTDGENEPGGVAVARALLAILDTPALLVRELEWKPYGLQPDSFAAESVIGCYRVECVENEWDWRSPGDSRWSEWISCDSLEDGKAACQSDYLARLGGIWRRG